MLIKIVSLSTEKRHNMTTDIDYHSVTENEQEEAVNLWHQIFYKRLLGFYKRYYSSAAPSYRNGDTLGAWCDGQLVSVVHICRLTLHNGDETYLCGGIANVATLPEYRERGISRHLLEQAVDKMKNEGFHISMLHSARHSHYEYAGFEQYSLSRQLLIDLSRNIDDTPMSSKFEWKTADVDEEIMNIYAKQSRPLQVNRSPEYFEGWVNWNWQQDKAILHVIPDEGYIILNKANDGDIYCASEWRATNREIEKQLLIRASCKALQLNSKQIRLAATPVFVGQQWIEENLGRIVKIEEDETSMIRNINLTTDEFDKVKSFYSIGKAILWPADYF
jgi:predicted acetyltransferase